MVLYNSRSQFDSQGYKVGFEQVLKLLLKLLISRHAPPLFSLGGGLKILENSLWGGSEIFILFYFGGWGGGVILLGRSCKSHNLNVKIEIA